MKVTLAVEGSEMSFCLGKRFSLGAGKVAPKPQDACALPRKCKHGPANDIRTEKRAAQSEPDRKRTRGHQAPRRSGRDAHGAFRPRAAARPKWQSLGSD